MLPAPALWSAAGQDGAVPVAVRSLNRGRSVLGSYRPRILCAWRLSPCLLLTWPVTVQAAEDRTEAMPETVSRPCTRMSMMHPAGQFHLLREGGKGAR